MRRREGAVSITYAAYCAYVYGISCVHIKSAIAATVV